MLKTKAEVSKIISKKCSEFLSNRETVQGYADQLLTQYKVPYGVSIDLLTLKTSILDAQENVIFYIVSVIDKSKIKSIFTDIEIKKYSRSKYIIKKISFPIKLDVIKISELQYNGRITVKQLIEMRDAQIINYNENTQRAIKRKYVNGVEYYAQDINRKSITQISDLMKNGEYISDQITLNLPEDSDWYYDDEEKQLVIKSADHLDITDGNHRYISISNLHNLNADFDYTMELRVTCFNEDKTNQFMYQVNQQNKLSKIDVELRNQNNPANQVIAMLNDTRALKGVLSRNGKVIDPGTFGILTSLLFFNKRKTYTRPEIVEVKKNLQEKLISVFESDTTLYEKKWSYSYILCVLYICSLDSVKIKDIPLEVAKLSSKIDKSTFEKREFIKADITKLEKIYKK